ncbi:hypothetical protein F4778DRAFT_92508 [Xylariomycetidae sp. FL2044]|nr:hypothetical protein F4778DRAFT_92508 [Xylariomycetidae sp. FL2044]
MSRAFLSSQSHLQFNYESLLLLLLSWAQIVLYQCMYRCRQLDLHHETTHGLSSVGSLQSSLLSATFFPLQTRITVSKTYSIGIEPDILQHAVLGSM